MSVGGTWRDKLERVKDIMSEFDSKYLSHDEQGREVYPEWALTYVQEMSEKIARYSRKVDEEERGGRSSRSPRKSPRKGVGSPSGHKRGIKYTINFDENLPFVRKMKESVWHTEKNPFYKSGSKSKLRSPRKNRSQPDLAVSTLTAHAPRHWIPAPGRTGQQSDSVYAWMPFNDLTNNQDKGSTLKRTKKRTKKGKRRKGKADCKGLRNSVYDLTTKMSYRLKAERETREAMAAQMALIGEQSREKFVMMLHQLQETTDLQREQKERLEELQEAYQDMQAASAEANARRAEFESLAASAKEHKEKVDLDYELLQTEVRQLERKNKSLRDQLDDSKNENDQANQLIKELQEELVTQKQQKESLMNQVLEMKQGSDSRKFELMERLNDKNRQYKELEAKLKELSETCLTYEKDLRASHEAERLLKNQLNSEKKIFQEEMSRLRKLARNLDKKKAGLDREVDDLKDARAELRRAQRLRRHGISPGEKLRAMVMKFLALNYRKQYVAAIERGDKVDEDHVRELQLLTERYENGAQMLARSHEKEKASLYNAIELREDLNKEMKEELERLRAEKDALHNEYDNLRAAIAQRDRDIYTLQERLRNVRISEDGESERARTFFKCIKRGCQSDYLKLGDNTAVYRQIRQHGDQEILFSDFVTKVNRRNAQQRRILLITENAIYNILPRSFEVRRRIKIANVGALYLGQKAHDAVVIKHESEYDYFYRIPKRTEVIYWLLHRYRQIRGKDLDWKWGDHLYVKDKGMNLRTIAIEETENIKFGSSNLVLPNHGYLAVDEDDNKSQRAYTAEPPYR